MSMDPQTLQLYMKLAQMQHMQQAATPQGGQAGPMPTQTPNTGVANGVTSLAQALMLARQKQLGAAQQPTPGMTPMNNAAVQNSGMNNAALMTNPAALASSVQPPPQ